MLSLKKILNTVPIVDAEFQKVKAESKVCLAKSKETIADISADLREEYNEIGSKRIEYETELAAAEAEGRTPPSADGVDLRSFIELQAELETQRTNLELNLSTNPGVVEQYEKRKRDVSKII